MSDRGDYRPIYRSFWDDPDVHQLDDRPYRVLTTLKGTLPATGIGVVYDLVLCQQCKCTREQLEEALRTLEAPKPGRELGWIVRDRNVVWVVNGLRFEASLSATDRKHRKFVQRLVQPLPPFSEVVRAFRAHYAEWFVDEPKPSPNEGASKGLPRGSEGSSKGVRRGTGALEPEPSLEPSREPSTSDSEHLDQERCPPAEPDRAAPPAAAPSRRVAELGDDVVAFCTRFYGGAPRERKDEIVEQLFGTLNGGASLRRGVLVTAGSLERLQAKCREVVAEGVKNPDRAIVVLLKKLGDVSQESPTEQLRVEQRAQEERDAADYAARRAAADAWLEAHPTEAATLRAKYARMFPVNPTTAEACLVADVLERAASPPQPMAPAGAGAPGGAPGGPPGVPPDSS